MEEKQPIPIMDNMPDDVKAIVDYLNEHNITFDDYKGDTDNTDIQLDEQPFYNGEHIEYDDSEIDLEEDEADADSLNDLNSMF